MKMIVTVGSEQTGAVSGECSHSSAVSTTQLLATTDTSSVLGLLQYLTSVVASLQPRLIFLVNIEDDILLNNGCRSCT